MSGNDREPIGRKGKALPPRSSAGRGRRMDIEQDIDQDDFNDDEEEAPVPRKGKGGKPPRGKRRWLGWVIKLFLVFVVVMAAWGIYLDSEIRSRIDGKVWQLPATVYGRMVSLEPGMAYNKSEMVALLEGTQYREVSRITRPGEFSVKGNTIELLRRPFDFPDSKEGQIHARMSFSKDELSEIKNLETGRDFGFFRLDPRLITMLQSPNGEQRLFVPRAGFPDLLVDTLIATEDRH